MPVVSGKMVPCGAFLVDPKKFPDVSHCPSPVPVLPWSPKFATVIMGSMKTGKTSLIANTVAGLPPNDTAMPHVVIYKPDSDCRGAVAEGSEQPYMDYSDFGPGVTVLPENALCDFLSRLRSSEDPAPLGTNPRLVVIDESHLLKETTMDLLLLVVECFETGPRLPFPIAIISIEKGIRAEVLPWAFRLKQSISNVLHLAAGCENCKGAPAWDVVSYHRSQSQAIGPYTLRVSELVGGHEDYINLCPPCRGGFGIELEVTITL